MAAAFVPLLGEELLTSAQGSRVKTAEALAGKVVGLYFSAHWCPPCKAFTPKLAGSYKDHLTAKGFEIVFVSSDKNEEAYTEYYKAMPWKALPYEARDQKAALAKKFNVSGIPTLVVLDTDGTLICEDASSNVREDPTGEDFPWRPKALSELLGTSFCGQAGAVLGKEAIENKVLGLYFSAHWCPPCRGFTPKLAEWYTKVKPNLPDFEIIFVSSDKTEDAFKEYFAEMPWIALPFERRKEKAALSERFGIEGIPAFVIVDRDGSTITTGGRKIPFADPEGKEFPWLPKPLKDLANDVDVIGENPSFVVLMEGADNATRQPILTALEKVAADEHAKAKQTGDTEVLIFGSGPTAQGMAHKIRLLVDKEAGVGTHAHPLEAKGEDRGRWQCDFCGGREGKSYACAPCNVDYCEPCHGKMAAGPTVALLLDMSQGGYALAKDTDLTDPSSIQAFVEKYKAGALTFEKFNQQ